MVGTITIALSEFVFLSPFLFIEGREKERKKKNNHHDMVTFGNGHVCFLKLQNVGINVTNIEFSSLTMESDQLICVHEKVNGTSFVIVTDMTDANNPIKRSITADSAIIPSNE